MKITVVGAGAVGASCAEYIAIKNFASEITQENPWIENNLRLSLIRSYALEKNWSLAGGIDILYLNRLNYKRAYNDVTYIYK